MTAALVPSHSCTHPVSTSHLRHTPSHTPSQRAHVVRRDPLLLAPLPGPPKRPSFSRSIKNEVCVCVAVFGGGSDATQNIDVEGLTHPSALIWRAIEVVATPSNLRAARWGPPLKARVLPPSLSHTLPWPSAPLFRYKWSFVGGPAPQHAPRRTTARDRTASEAAAKKSCVRAGANLPTFSPVNRCVAFCRVGWIRRLRFSAGCVVGGCGLSVSVSCVTPGALSARGR